MSIYEKLSKNEFCLKLYKNYKQKKYENEKKKRIKGKYKFINRCHNYEKMCIVLAGYKDFLWDDVFGRIIKYIPMDIDVCIVSSGLYNERLNQIAQENDWSYLSVKQNKVTLVQNIAINLFPNAKYIYKLDEDIFITENFFSQLIETYKKVEKTSNYRIGFVAPLIPINGFCNVEVLKKVGLIEDFQKKFGKPYCDGGSNEIIIKNPNVAKYLWGENNKEFKDIDLISRKLSKNDFSYLICPLRFSIGAILFTRDIWDKMGRFMVRPGTNMGLDEEQFCKFCMIESRVIVVSENTLVGHFSYGPQTSAMKEYYEKNRNVFKIKKEQKK